MNQIDRLLLKATGIRPAYKNLYIISNETGTWKIEEKDFPSLEAAEKYIDEIADGEVLVIINDAGPGMERGAQEYGEDKIKAGNPVRCAPDIKTSNKHGRKRRNGSKDSQYNHTWV